MILKKDQEVWIYNPPCCPYRAKIVEQVDNYDAYKIRTEDMNISQVKSYIRDRIFIYPDEKEKLICKLKDDSWSLNEYANELFQED